MTDLRALAGGVIVCGFEGTALSADTARELRDLHLAGVVLFARNTHAAAQTRALTDQLRATLELPLIAIDQEGGRVMRLREGVAPVPPMREIGASGDPAMAELAGAELGAGLRSAGVNVNFAPVLDLALLETNRVIGDRSFGSDPQSVTRFGAALARGLESHGILPVFKHFPGYGSSEVDAHVDLPRVTASEAVSRERDLVPFAALLPGAQAVMTAHVVVEAFDANVPATLSPRILTGLLRGEIGFPGVCFTDCMEMDAIARDPGTVAASVRAIAAGADCLVISHHLDAARACAQALAAAVEDGSLPAARLEEAYGRVRRVREALW